ncbi:MAG: neutral ceramidase [Verrucomicrobiales bacterium]|jgi:neutral ceramidase
MARIPRSLILIAALAIFTPAAHADPLKAGMTAVDVTPKVWPLNLVGSFYPQPADSAHDPLNSRCMVLSDGKTTLAIAVVDNCLIKREVLDEAKQIASKKTGIPTNHMMVSATHTHSAPTGHADENGSPEAQAYRKQLTAGIAESIINAHASMQDAQVGHGGHDLADEVNNRRWFLQPNTMPMNPFGETTDIVKMNPGSKGLISPAGPIDPEVSILSIRDKKGQPIGLLGNYSLHYVGSIPGRQMSADYFGEFSRLIGNRLRREPGKDFLGIMSNGTSGDINNIPFGKGRPPREPFEQIRIVAGKVADAAYYAYRDANHQNDVKLAMVQREITLKWRKPDADLLARSKKYLATEDEKELPRLAKHYARRVIDLAEGPDTLQALIQVIQIGDLAICTFPFETFAEIGLHLKEVSPFDDTFTIELANGWYGYLPTKEQHKFGGYETWMGTCRVQKDAADILVKNLEEMMAELKK